jgi:hypothetical protein
MPCPLQDGKTLASGAKDGTAILWELPSGKERATLPSHKKGK